MARALRSTRARGVHLGHRRLAIIDLAGGEQPMWNEDGRGRRRLQRRDLQPRSSCARAAGARATSSGPTIPTPRCWCTATRSGATELPLRLNGMFAFAIYDRARRRLFLRARPLRQEAALLHAAAGTVRLRLRADGAARAIRPWHRAIDAARAAEVLRLRLHSRAALALRGRVPSCRAAHSLTFDLARRDGCACRKYWRFRDRAAPSDPGERRGGLGRGAARAAGARR